MRMRAKRNRDVRFERVSHLFAAKDTDGFIITKDSNVYIEIGCGKGTFCTQLAERCPDADITAIELSADAMLMAMEKAASLGSENLHFCNCNADGIDSLFREHSVDRIYLNFSDPWPRNKHAKRRLTAPSFLNKYKTVLKDGGEIIFKTDNRGLFDYSLSTFAECGFCLEKVLFDLHSSELDAENIRTEYENNFTAKGFKINYLRAKLCAGDRALSASR